MMLPLNLIEIMKTRDWLVMDNGKCQACLINEESKWSNSIYRLYRFLTEVEDIILTVTEDRRRLQLIRPLVRRLLTSSYWLQGEFLEPLPDTGFSILKLYEEPNFGLSVEIVACVAGTTSPIYNYGSWAISLILSGGFEYSFWQYCQDPNFPNKIQPVGKQIVSAGELMSFMPNAIHQVQSIGEEITVSFRVRGEISHNKRLEFDPYLHTAEVF